jgi:hypothetical protein
MNGIANRDHADRQGPRRIDDGDVEAATAPLVSAITRWPTAAYVYGVIVALGLAYFIAKSPLQVSDCVDNLLEVQRNGFRGTVVSQFLSHAFLRPFLWAQLAITFDLANGHYQAMYKTVHALQLVATVLLFVRLLRVTSLSGLLSVPVGVAMLFASHTFAGTVVEGFPINTFLTIVVCCLVAANLSFAAPSLTRLSLPPSLTRHGLPSESSLRRHGLPPPPVWWRDVAAAVLFVFAAFTVESGLLVWVIVCAAWLTGARGVSTRGVIAMTALMLAYFALRFGPLHVGMPALIERSSGFGFRVLDPPELIARFGDHPWVFYAYNVMCQLVTVLIGEPRNGVWMFARRWTTGELLPRDFIAVGCTIASTLLIVWYAWSRRHDWRRGVLEHGDRLVVLFVAVLGANAALSYAYTKDVIVSPAGVFHALAATVAFRHALASLERARAFRIAPVVVSCGLMVLSTGWAVRLVGLHYHLHDKAVINRNDWAEMGPTTTRWHVPEDPQGAVLVRQLYEQAVRMRVPGTYFYPANIWKYFQEPW